MEERFPDEFVTWHHKTPVGVKVDEVFGMDSKSGKVWRALARQIYCEQGEPAYRELEHFSNGAPFLEGYPGRISLTHTDHFFAVATLPKTPEVNLDGFNPRSAMGIDAEQLNRAQVLKIREKFLSDRELQEIPADDLEANIIAWTVKEALYKAAFLSSVDYRNELKILSLPPLDKNPETPGIRKFGEGEIIFKDSPSQPMILYAYESYGCCVTIAISPKAAKFGK